MSGCPSLDVKWLNYISLAYYTARLSSTDICQPHYTKIGRRGVTFSQDMVESESTGHILEVVVMPEVNTITEF